MSRAIYLLVWMLTTGIIASAAPARTNHAPVSFNPENIDTLRVSLITCWPGPEVYELCGHEAIRVAGPNFDLVWNYGTFDFREPNFIGRFVSGETDYKVMSYPFRWFLPEYLGRGSRVEEQVLDLTPFEKQELLRKLSINALPNNATYRYNYVKDNCATRITAMLDSASDRRIIFPDTTAYGTYRRVMRRYHANYPWYQFGIDLVLGNGLDRKISRQEETFAPLEMHDAFAEARFSDGGKVVSETFVLNEGRDDAILPPTPWYLTPMAAAIAVLLISLLVVWRAWRYGRLIRIWYTIFFGLTGVAGCIVAYLVFFSSHEATSPNLNLIWLNPLQLLLAIAVWSHRARYIGLAVALYDVVATLVLLIAWPMQHQCANPATFPLMLSMIILAGEYAIFISSDRYAKKGATETGRRGVNSRRRRK